MASMISDSLSGPIQAENIALLYGLIGQVKRTPVMITGQQKEASLDIFKRFYEPAIDAAIKSDDRVVFLLGAAPEGVDKFAADYLQERKYEHVIIFDKGSKDGNKAAGKGWILVNGFKSYPERDLAMARLAKKMIVYLFENAVTSGTFFNVMSFFQSKIDNSKLPGLVSAIGHSSLARVLDRSTEYASKTWELETHKILGVSSEMQPLVETFVSEFFYGAAKVPANKVPAKAGSE